MSFSKLSQEQIIREVYNSGSDSLNVFIAGGSPDGGLNVISTHVIDFSSIPDSASAPLEINASLGNNVKQILLFDTTGEVLQLRTGAAVGSLLVYTAPGQDQPIPASILAGTRVSIRSNGAAPVAGNVTITFLGQ